MALTRVRSRLPLLAVVALPAALLVATPAHAAVPGNDGIASATPVDLTSGNTGSSANLFPNTTDATTGDSSADGALSGDEGQAQRTVWYQLQPTAGRVTVTVHSDTIDHVVAGVVTSPQQDPVDGTADEFDLIEDANVANTDSDQGQKTLTVTPGAGVAQSFSFTADSQWVADANHSYYLGVGVIGDATTAGGPASVTVDDVYAPVNDAFADALPIVAGTPDKGDTTGATPEFDGGTTNLDPVVSGPSMFSAWFTYTATANGLATISTDGTDFHPVLEVCESAVPSISDCVSHSIVDSASDSTATPSVSFDVVAGGVYYVFLDGQPVAGGPNAAGLYKLAVQLNDAPGNDDITAPKVLAGKGIVRVDGSNIGASNVVLGASPPASTTTEAAHGLVFNGGAKHTVWYSYTPKQSGRVVLTASGPLNTDVEVFTGSLAKGFKDTGFGNDDYAPGFTYSRVPMTVTKGTTYTIGVDGSSQAVYPQDHFSLALGASPANDNLKHAAFLKKHKKASAASGKVTGSTEFATLQGNEKFIKKQQGLDTWYTFVAPKGGKYHFTESLASGFAAIGVYSGKGKSTLGQGLITYKAAGKPKPVTLSFKASPGQRFAIEVSGILGSAGAYTLSWH